MNGQRCAIPNFVWRISRRAALRFHSFKTAPAITPRLLAWLLVFIAQFAASDFLAAQETKAQETKAVEPQKLFQTGQYVECVEAAAKAIAASEFSETARLFKLRAEMELGRYADAAATLDAGLKQFPSSLELRWLGRDVCRYTNQLERSKLLEAEIGLLLQQYPGRYSDAANRIILGRFLLAQGLDPKRILDGAYNAIKKFQPGYVPAYIASGELALEKGDFSLAAQDFERAAKLDPTDPDAQFGIARAYVPSDSAKANAALQAAIKQNPNHVGALLLTIDELIDSEQYDKADTLLLHLTGINPHQPRAAAYRAVLAHLRYQADREKSSREAGLKYWTTNPEVDYLIGKKLSQKYRFAEGSEHQRAALKLEPTYLPAKMQLAQDLLRLGQETEGWKLADEVHNADGYNVVAHNLVTLQQSVEKFRTLEEDGIVAKMDAREAEIYGRRVLDLLKRAKQVLCSKYGVEIKTPIVVELFPKQEDFAIRTFGLPGGAGFLGVCFGTVITANSPASQGAHPSCWESTLWHEFCHVVTLNKTRNRMPRWLSEGISVYEERQADPSWGQAISPISRKMLLGDELTPVDQLSGAFLRPSSPQHLQFAYFESSLVVEYLVEKHGIETLKKILEDLGQGITINDTLGRHTGSLEELNKGFTQFARQKAEAMAPEAEWSEPELPKRADAAEVIAWLKEHPKNYPGLQRVARQLIVAKQWEAAKQPLEAMRKLYPGDGGTESLYPLLARVHRELKEIPQERAALEQLAGLSDSNTDAFARLAELTAAAGEWDLSRKYAERWLAVSPLQPAPHRIAATAAEHLNDEGLAISSYQAVLLLNPVDIADLHLKLATAFQRTGDLTTAKQHALLAVEEAPRFRAGHHLLLQIVRQLEPPKTHPNEGTADRPAAPALPETVLAPKPETVTPPSLIPKEVKR
jgi:hypothetical protein